MDTQFQGVACCCLDSDKTTRGTILELLDLKVSSRHQGVECFNLDLSNKYYKATIHLFDYNTLNDKIEKPEDILENCHAIILFANGRKTTINQLDNKVEQLSVVQGEPRILIYDGIDEDCEPFKTLRDWSIKNGYDLVDVCDEGAREILIDSLSAYKWVHRSDVRSAEASKIDHNQQDNPQLNGELLKKLTEFDSLLGKLSAYRDRPELRGNPDDKNIIEIAEILSGLLGDDVDDFLDNEEGSTNNLS